MNFLIMGAGAIGTYIGGSLIKSGSSAVYLETPEMAARIAESGLRLKLQDGIFGIPSPSVFGSIQECLARGPFEAAIIAIKSFDTEPLLNEIEAYIQDMPPVLCLQNGVENEEKIANRFGDERVLSGTVTSAVGRLPDGEVVLERLRGAGIAGNSLLAGQILAAFNRAGLNARLFTSAVSMKWSKMLTNLISNASSAILKMTPAEVFSDPDLFQIEIEQLRETLRVMRALGCQVVNLPGTPVQLLAAAVQYLPPKISQPLLNKAVGSGRGAKMPSLYLDLYSGRGKSEVGYLNGAVVKYGDKLGIPTPVNRLLNDTLSAIVSGEAPLEVYTGQPAKLIEQWRMSSIAEIKKV